MQSQHDTHSTQDTHDEILGNLPRGRHGSYRMLVPYILGLPALICFYMASNYYNKTTLAGGSFLILMAILPKCLQVLLPLIRMRFWLGSEELIIMNKIFVETKVRIPYAHIHGVSASTSALEKLLGLVTLNIETSSDSSIRADALRCLDAEEARGIITFITERNQLGEQPSLSEANPEQEALQQTQEHDQAETPTAWDFSDFSSIRLLHMALLRFRLRKILIAVVGISAFFNSITDALELFGVSDHLVSYGETLTQSGIYLLVALSLALLVALVAFCLIAAIVYEILRLWGFSITDKDGSLSIRRGFISEHIRSINKERIYGLKVHQSIPQRMAGYASLSLSVMGDTVDPERTQGEILFHPCIKLNDIEDFLQRYTPEYGQAYAIKPETYLGTRAKRRIVRKSLLIYAGVLSACMALCYCLALLNLPIIDQILLQSFLIIALLILSIHMLLSTYWELETSAYKLDHTCIVYRRARLETTAQYLPRRSLEFAQCNQTMFQLRPQLCDFYSSTLAATELCINELTLAEAQAIKAWVAYRK